MYDSRWYRHVGYRWHLGTWFSAWIWHTRRCRSWFHCLRSFHGKFGWFHALVSFLRCWARVARWSFENNWRLGRLCRNRSFDQHGCVTPVGFFGFKHFGNGQFDRSLCENFQKEVERWRATLVASFSPCCPGISFPRHTRRCLCPSFQQHLQRVVASSDYERTVRWHSHHGSIRH